MVAQVYRGKRTTISHLVVAGSLLEGGGQILRNATALSAITGKSIQVDKIRAGQCGWLANNRDLIRFLAG